MITLPQSIDCLFVSHPDNIYYLIHFRPLTAPNEHSVYLCITNSHTYLVTYRMFEEEARQAIEQEKDCSLLFIEQGSSLTQQLAFVQQKHGLTTIGIEHNHLFYEEYKKIKQALPNSQIVEGSDWIEQYRLYKNENEINKIQTAGTLAEQCFQTIRALCKTGVTEMEIAWKIEVYIREHHAQLAFPPIVAFGTHTALPHHVPTTKPLGEHDPVLLDFGASWESYMSDISRSFYVGEPPYEWQKAYDTVQRAEQEAVQYLSQETPVYGDEADNRARNILAQHGYNSYPHSLGHGVGLEIHENPRLTTSRHDIIAPSMVFTIEPAVYIPNQFGIRLEDTYVKTKEGLVVLTGIK